MSSWNIMYGEGVTKDLDELDGSVRPQVLKAIFHVAVNPLPRSEGGYGVELGNKGGADLRGCLKIKLKKVGIRVIYTLKRTEQGMKIIIIGLRANNSVYEEAARRLGR